MRLREGWSYAPLPSTTRGRWQRPDGSRTAAATRTALPSADPMVPELDETEPMTVLDHFAMLPEAARRDLQAGLAGDGR